MKDVSVVIPALNEAENLAELLPKLRVVLSKLPVTFEIIVVDGGSKDNTAEVTLQHGAQMVRQSKPGYGGALEAGFRAAQGAYILTLDGDQSHDPELIPALWDARRKADVVIASRYVPGGGSDATRFRKTLSQILNAGLAWVLDIQVHDLSGGFRLYRNEVVRNKEIKRSDFACLVEIIVLAYAGGWQVTEVPFHYRERQHGVTHARVIPFGLGFLRTAYKMWKWRNSIACADYDARAYHSRIPFQRYWQRRRYKHVTRFAKGYRSVLDVGCGSSQILAGVQGMIGLDIQLNKLRYDRRYRVPLVAGTVFSLPFADTSVDCVICSEVIEHIPDDPSPLDELLRVLRPGGCLVLGTPDYGTWVWPTIEYLYGKVAPGAYADEHITHYTKAGLIELLGRYGLKVQELAYIAGGELIIKAIKPA